MVWVWGWGNKAGLEAGGGGVYFRETNISKEGLWLSELPEMKRLPLTVASSLALEVLRQKLEEPGRAV